MLIAIPSTLLMYSGLLLALCPFDFVSRWLGWITEWLLILMMRGLKFIENLPYALSTGVFWDIWLLLLFVSLLISMLIAFDRRNKIALWTMLVLSFLLIFYQKIQVIEKEEYMGFRIYNVRSELAIAALDKEKVVLYSSLDSMRSQALEFSVLPDLRRYAAVQQIDFNRVDLAKRMNFELELNGKRFFIVEGMTSDVPENLDFIIWRKNNRNVISDVHQKSPKAIIIVDGSNSDRNIERIKEETKGYTASMYYLKNNFAYVWDEE